MLLYVIFLLCISVVSGNNKHFDGLLNEFGLTDEIQTELTRNPRQVPKRDFAELTPTCLKMTHNVLSPFIVLLLYKSSGHFLGMGSILDEKTILSAAKAVQNTMEKPHELLILAGRLCPWWGRDSQVHEAAEIFQNDNGLALIVLKKELTFNKHVLPIQIPIVVPGDFLQKYGKSWAVFGIPRSSWDIPGDETSKTNIYIMKIESVPDKLDDCKTAYPDLEFNETTMACTYANGSYCWGCIGSPTVSMDDSNQVIQIAVLTRATFTDKDEFHIHIKLPYNEQWIRSHTLLNYK